MNSKRLRIPRTITLPFGWVVRIVTMDDKDFEEDFGDSLASWVVEEMSIYLRGGRTIKQRRADFAHEMGHVFMDWQEAILGSKHADLKS